MAGSPLKRVKLLKIGGSVLTYKDGDSELNPAALAAAVTDIQRWLAENPDWDLILITGGGSFGHPLAHRYRLNEPSAEKSELGFVRITTNMQRMGQAVASAFQAQEVALFPIAPSAIFSTDQGRIAASTLDPILEALERGLVPFLWGDAVLDRSHTYRILSGDQIMTYLCEQLQIGDLLFGSDVGGIYTTDPRRDSSARLIDRVDDATYPAIRAALSDSSRLDVTRGMQGKIEEVYATRQRPLRCTIYNALEPGNTYRALSGEAIGTALFFTAGENK